MSMDPLERRGLWFSVSGPLRKKRSLDLSLDALERKGLWVSVSGPLRKKRSLDLCHWTL